MLRNAEAALPVALFDQRPIRRVSNLQRLHVIFIDDAPRTRKRLQRLAIDLYRQVVTVRLIDVAKALSQVRPLADDVDHQHPPPYHVSIPILENVARLLVALPWDSRHDVR